MRRIALNLRDLGGIPLQGGKCKTPHGLYLRSGKLGALTLDVYSLSGQKVKSKATSLDGLPHGIYIINGKKVIK